MIEIARIYQIRGDLLEMNRTMHSGTQNYYKLADDYYSIWSQWAEMLLEEGFYQDALRVIKQILFKKKTHADSP